VVSGVRLLDCFTESVRAGGGAEILDRYLTGPQEEFDAFTDNLLALRSLTSPFEMPVLQGTDGLNTLDYALWLVGFTSELRSVTAVLDSDQKRRLLRAACALWRRKGLPYGWQRWVRLFTGMPSIYRPFVDARHLVGDDFLEEAFILAMPDAAYQSDLIIQDPGATLRQVVLRMVNLTRPASQRVYLRWPEFVEPWDTDLRRWGYAGTAALDTAARTATITPAATYLVATTSYDWAWYTLEIPFTMGQAGRVEFVFHVQGLGLNASQVELNTTTQRAYLVREWLGGEIAVADAALPVLLVPDVEYRLQLSVSPFSGPLGENQVCTLRLDGNPVFSVAFNGSDRGRFGFRARHESSLTIGPVVAYDLPLEHDFAAPSGAVDDEV